MIHQICCIFSGQFTSWEWHTFLERHNTWNLPNYQMNIEFVFFKIPSITLFSYDPCFEMIYLKLSFLLPTLKTKPNQKYLLKFSEMKPSTLLVISRICWKFYQTKLKFQHCLKKLSKKLLIPAKKNWCDFYSTEHLK